jgi:L-histidine N-alpha-methyltransferase
LPLEIAKELRDALDRRQKELPARWLAAYDAAAIRRAAPLPGHAFEDAEREIGLTIIRRASADLHPRAVVCVQPSASRVTPSLMEALRKRGSIAAVAVTELDATLASAMTTELAGSTLGQTGVPIVTDCTVDLPLSDRFPRPRVYLCLGNAIGSTTTVGAVRMLRVLRTTMSPGDALVLGLETRVDASDSEVDVRCAERHMAALRLVSSVTGANMDLARFEFRRALDPANNRHETHLVARRAFQLEVPGVCDIRLRKGESIRTSVSCAFDRNRVVAMMNGVGLTLREWQTDPSARFAVALAIPAV